MIAPIDVATASIRADYIQPGGRLARRDDGCLNILPPAGQRFPWVRISACLTLVVAAGIAAFFGAPGGGLWVAVPAVAAVGCGLGALSNVAGRRRAVARFDRRMNQFDYHAPTDTVTFPLEAVAGIQILHFSHMQPGAGETEAWELNVLIEGSPVKRFCVACGVGGNGAAAGRELAEFVGVPLISHPIVSTWTFNPRMLVLGKPADSVASAPAGVPVAPSAEGATLSPTV